MANIVDSCRRDGGDRFMRNIQPGSALWNKQMGQFAKRPNTVLDIWQIYQCRNPFLLLSDLAKAFVRDYKQENPNLGVIANHPGFDQFIYEECVKARACSHEYADIV